VRSTRCEGVWVHWFPRLLAEDRKQCSRTIRRKESHLRCWRMHTVPCCAKREEQQMMLLTCWRSRSVVMHCVTNRLEQNIILQDDISYPRISCLSLDRIPTNDWLLPHLPYSPTLAPQFRKGWVATNETADCLHAAEMDLYGKGTLKFLERWQNRVGRDGDFVTPVNTVHKFDWHVVFSHTQFYLTVKLICSRLPARPMYKQSSPQLGH